MSNPGFSPAASPSSSTPASATTASPPPRPVVMDPLHITEFASDRYFTKLQQQHQHEQQLRRNGSKPSTAGPSVTQTEQSPFMLPLRDTRTLDMMQDEPTAVEPKQKRLRFTLGRLLHSKQSQQQQPQPQQPQQPQHLFSFSPIPPSVSAIASLAPQDAASLNPAFTEAYSSPAPTAQEKPSRTFDVLFLSLPAELQIQVIASMPLADILRLRLASKSWHAMITANESPIVRYHLTHNIPAYAKRLFPPDYTNLNLHYLCGLWHRLHVAAKLSFYICEWVTKEIFLRVTEAQRREFAPQRERMRRRLIPLLFTIFHFFETYRQKHLQYIMEHDGKGLMRTPYTVNPIEAEILSTYDDRTLLQVHQVFPLVVASFCRRLRPPSYVGRVERSLRGYLKDKPADEVHVAALCIGGLRQVERFWEVKGYNNRRSLVDVWYNSITMLDLVTKPRRGLMGLGRKKSTMAVDSNDDESSMLTAATAKLSIDGEDTAMKDTSSTPDQQQQQTDNFADLVFHTSMADGMPMGPMTRDQLRLLIPDLPVLQQLWLVTAEAMVLERKIVLKAADILRNGQVMMDLIREDGYDDEDEWWYGQGGHESVRPPADAMDDNLQEDFGLHPGLHSSLHPGLQSGLQPGLQPGLQSHA